MWVMFLSFNMHVYTYQYGMWVLFKSVLFSFSCYNMLNKVKY